MTDDILTEKIRKAITNPEKVPPYISKKVSQSLLDRYARLQTWRRTKDLETQSEYIEDLRDDSDWLLIILDACRYDYLAEAFDRYFIGDVFEVKSVAHDTFEYIRLCWPDYYEDVTYVSGTPAINSSDAKFENDRLESLYDGFVPSDHLPNIVDAWESGWDTSLGVCPPEPVTDAALETESTQTVVHYSQPHTPYIGAKEELGYTEGDSGRPMEGRPSDELIWDRVRSGEISDDELHELYISNLERVLPEVCQIIEHSDADRTIITSDHGEALGEYGTYAHPRKEHPHLRVVPWAEIRNVRSQVDTSRQAAAKRDEEAEDQTITDRLQDLGYLQ